MPGFSPLDEYLGLRAGSPLTPWLTEHLVLLGTLLPFAKAVALLARFTGVRVGEETARRVTHLVGTAQAALDTAAVAELMRTLPDEPKGPAVQLMSVDGVMVPLVGPMWAEVKLAAIGEVVSHADGPRTGALSYFARLTDADTFADLASAELHRRGTVTAETVVAVTDGARWCQSFVDLHRPDAVRILDFPHAVEHLSLAAQTVFGPGTAAASEWLGVQRHALRHGDEELVLTAIGALALTPGLAASAVAIVDGVLTYLRSRREQIQYQAFVAAGWPIGSGCVESGNKLVVEARLKGAGMHWQRANVNAMLALRTVDANGCWDERWPSLWRAACLPRATRPPVADAPVPPPSAPPIPDSPPPRLRPQPKTISNGRPTNDHPWKQGYHSRAKT